MILGTVSKEKFLYPKQESTRGGVWLQEVELRQILRACRESLFWRVADVLRFKFKPGQRAAGKQGTPLQKQCQGAVNQEPLCSTVLAVSRESQKRYPAGDGLSVVWFF